MGELKNGLKEGLGEPPADLAPGTADSGIMAPASTLSEGERRVRIMFNPSGDGVVHEIKTKAAELINLCETLKGKDPRCAALAQTHFEDAAMWAVKAATA